MAPAPALAICVALAGAVAPAAPAQPPASQASATPLNAPAAEPTVANRLAIERMSTLIAAEDFAAAGQVVEEALRRLGPQDPFPDELRGTLLAHQKQYAAAEASFRAMLKKAPQSRVGRFNLNEVIFVAGRYSEAEGGFAELEKECVSDPAMADFCRFKRVVCLLAAGDSARARALLPEGGDLIVSPAVRYSRAALLYASHDSAGAAREIGEARQDFSAAIESTFVDAFIELGWGSRTASAAFAFNAGPK